MEENSHTRDLEEPRSLNVSLKEMVTIVDGPSREMVTIVDNTKLREMVEIVDNTKLREMVEIVDNTKLREMFRIVDKPAIDVGNALSVRLAPQVERVPSCINQMYIGDGGFSYENGMLMYDNTPFLNCQIEIVDILHSEDGDYYRCRVLIKGQYIMKDIPTHEFNTGKWVFGIVGVAYIGERRGASTFLQAYLDYLLHALDIQRYTDYVTKPGWKKIKDKWVYITPQGVIADAGIRAFSKHGQKFKKLYADDTAFSRYLNMMNITKSSVGPILVLYVAMSLCSSLFREAGFTPKFLLFVNGHRGSYKTSLSLAMSQLEFHDAPQYTLKATKAGLESSFKTYRDSVMLVDDLAPTLEMTDRRIMQSNLETVVRAFGDGTGHKRATVQYESEGGAIITGEYTTGCESSMARCLFLNLNRDDVNLGLLSILQDNKHMVEEFAIVLISKLTYMMNEGLCDVVKFIESRGKELRREWSRKFSNERYSEYIAQLMVTAQLLLSLAKQFKLLYPSELEEYAVRFNSAILDVIYDNDKRLIQQSPINVLCSALNMALIDEKLLICKLGIAVSDLDNVLLHDDDYYYISQKMCCSVVNEYIKENDLSMPEFTSTRVADTLENYGVIDFYLEGKTKRKSIKLKGYGSRRFMKVKKAELTKHLNS